MTPSAQYARSAYENIEYLQHISWRSLMRRMIIRELIHRRSRNLPVAGSHLFSVVCRMGMMFSPLSNNLCRSIFPSGDPLFPEFDSIPSFLNILPINPLQNAKQ